MLKNFQVIELISSKTKALMTVYSNKLKFNIYTAVDLKGKSYPMPNAFATMYDDRHLAITKATSERPEMFDIDSDEYYIPLRC